MIPEEEATKSAVGETTSEALDVVPALVLEGQFEAPVFHNEVDHRFF